MLWMHNTPWPCMICDGDTIHVLHSCLHTHAKSMSHIWKKHTVYCNMLIYCQYEFPDVCMWLKTCPGAGGGVYLQHPKFLFNILQQSLLHTIILHLHYVLLVNVIYSTSRKAVRHRNIRNSWQKCQVSEKKCQWRAKSNQHFKRQRILWG